jgi:hypothetical protein
MAPNQISDRTAPDFNLLAAACSQDCIDIVIRFFLFGGDIVGLSIAILYGASKCYAPMRNLIATIKSSTPLDETSSLRKSVGSLPKTLLESLLFETLPGYRFEQAIPRLLVRMAHANMEQE